MGDHMPVHLGSMPMSVRAAIAHGQLAPGDMVMLNDPFAGGTHLPDITLSRRCLQKRCGLSAAPGQHPILCASRAHHADVGGTYPGSMDCVARFTRRDFAFPR